jgi:hypothetical protein
MGGDECSNHYSRSVMGNAIVSTGELDRPSTSQHYPWLTPLPSNSRRRAFGRANGHERANARDLTPLPLHSRAVAVRRLPFDLLHVLTGGSIRPA